MPYYPVLQYHADGSHDRTTGSSTGPGPTRRSASSRTAAATPRSRPRPRPTTRSERTTRTAPCRRPTSRCGPAPTPRGPRRTRSSSAPTPGSTPRGAAAYESAQTPWQTDQLNEQYIGKASARLSPLGDPVPFSAYLIGRLVNPTELLDPVQPGRRPRLRLPDVGLDPRRPAATRPPWASVYHLPVAAPWLDRGPLEARHDEPMQLHYVDPPPPPVIIESPRERRRSGTRTRRPARDDADAGGRVMTTVRGR